ncbi:hypothetical protein AB0M41_29835 [Streptomyces sp. NPDC051896]|uniref:hypothetical protein n=1 Tax=Streptomyces sp. NPDC051896 TaxID=3155416 RepID=UPI003412893E
MTTLLEARYRTVLRLLPAYYRREREEEMVETYLEDLDRDTQDQSRPTLGEVASIAALAVRSRLGAAGAPRRYVLLGSGARLFALAAVLFLAASAVVEPVLRLTWSFTRGGAERRLSSRISPATGLSTRRSPSPSGSCRSAGRSPISPSCTTAVASPGPAPWWPQCPLCGRWSARSRGRRSSRSRRSS